ncbi:hypothetical protein ACYSNX_01050 [Myroides sp. LJL115]
MKQKVLANIARWIESSKNLEINYLSKQKRVNVKFLVEPWCNLNMDDSPVLPLEGEYKEAFLNGLVEIYHSWKQTLEQLKEPYYLKIWLFEKQLHRSQVVCAIEESLDFYASVFEPCETSSFLVDSSHAKKIKQTSIQWEPSYELQLYEADFVGDLSQYSSEKEYLESKEWFELNVIEKAYTIMPYGKSICYLVKTDTVWLGQSI